MREHLELVTQTNSWNITFLLPKTPKNISEKIKISSYI